MRGWIRGLGTGLLLALAGAAQADGPIDVTAENWADVVAIEIENGRPMPAVSAYDPAFNLRTAYAVQRALVERLYHGKPVGGYKAGFTSAAAQKKYYLRAPVSGVLPGAGRLASGAVVDAGKFRKLMVEIEFGYVLLSPIRRKMTSIADLRTYISAVVPAIELPDVDFEKPNSLIGLDIVATNIAARAYIIGKPLPLRDMNEVNALKVTLSHDGKPIDEGLGSNALGNQLEALRWLVNHLVERGETLLPGQVLITGALGKINPGLPGHYVADYGGKGQITFEVKAAPAKPAAKP